MVAYAYTYLINLKPYQLKGRLFATIHFDMWAIFLFTTYVPNACVVGQQTVFKLKWQTMCRKQGVELASVRLLFKCNFFNKKKLKLIADMACLSTIMTASNSRHSFIQIFGHFSLMHFVSHFHLIVLCRPARHTFIKCSSQTTHNFMPPTHFTQQIVVE